VVEVSRVLDRLLDGGGTGPRRWGIVSPALAGIDNIGPFPDGNRLLVFCETEESVEFLDQFIAELDQPTDSGLPFVIELKHADAEEVAQKLNLLLAPAGRAPGLESPLAGHVRIVPMGRGNTLAILCPARHREAMRELVSVLDRPE
jgi:type II secretory pathway component GspD/PulD (secretin)